MHTLLHTLRITCDNGSRAIFKLDPADFIKVSIDKGRPSDTRVRLAYIEPFTRAYKTIDLFFMDPQVTQSPDGPQGPDGPFVSSVAWDSNEPVSSPDVTYELLAGLPMDQGNKGDQGERGTDGNGGQL